MPFTIKIIIVLAVISFFGILIWRESRKNPYHNFNRVFHNGREVAIINYSALIFISLAAVVVVFSLPSKNLSFIISGLFGLAGAFVGMKNTL